jgi:hypothetical protein
VHEVFRFLRDFENDAQWRDELLGIQRLDGCPDTVGARYRQRVHWEERTLETMFEVSRIDLDRRIEFQGISKDVVATASYTFDRVGEDATKVTVSATFETSGPLNILEAFMRALITRQFEHDVESLQRLLNTRAEFLREERDTSKN